jgi:nucleoside phosphorylase
LLRDVPGEDGWSQQLNSLVAHLVASEKAVTIAAYEVDVCIVTALRSPEYEAIIALPVEWSNPKLIDSNTYVQTGEIESEGQKLSIVAATCSRMGATETALISAKLIHYFRPRFLMMTGICAGVQGKTNVGDVIVANPTWDWQSCKRAKREDGTVIELPAKDFISLERDVSSRIEAFAADKKNLNEIKSGWLGESPQTELRVCLGPLATGSIVVADGETLLLIKEKQHKEVLGLEMETYALYAAARAAGKPRPIAISLKAVCDFGDYLKDDRFQRYAAYTSARCLHSFLKLHGRELKKLTDF